MTGAAAPSRRASPLAALALAALGLAGCAATAPPTPALLSLDGRPCAAAPALDPASPVAMRKPMEPYAGATAEIDGRGACLVDPGGARSLYVVFALPESAEPYVISVASVPLGETILAPRVLVLDARGAVLRERGRDDFAFRGTRLEAGLRAYPGDRFLVVASDPASVGRRDTQVVGQIQSTPVCSMYGCFYVNTGAERSGAYVYAHNGRVVVAAEPMPKVN
jgi:hypothetical protein